MIIVNNEEALRVKCEPALSEEVGPIVEQLERELEHSARLGRPGIGLAAPQIGIAKKVAIVRLEKYNINLINCNITDKYYPYIFEEEGCLSFPNRVENTNRYQEIVIENNLSYHSSFVATGLLAVVVQHELDHLNAILLPDIAIPKIIRKVKPNDPCICGKGKKYKKCCGVK